ncbi:rab11 interacting protein isoform X1 [Lycorma delicatula]|uniref:rab11 interacting protein isoform X1 n=1 Tax=Lycorma delicatula TaxID=130591 RepID=UPI003F50EB56
MWSPTHVQVTVQKARGLITKGKNGTNNAFVTIALGKEKYQTSLKEKATDSTEWHEKCELQIPKQGNTAEITLTALHRNFVGVDEFLGCISIPLSELDIYERPKNKWYTLKDKPKKDKKKARGELEVKVAFIVKAAGSLADLSKKEKHKSSLGSLAFSGSLISISSLDKRKGLKKLASKISRKVGKNRKNDEDNDQVNSQLGLGVSKQVPGEADPGVISEGESEDDFTDNSQDESVELTPVNVESVNGDKPEDEEEDDGENLEFSVSIAEKTELESTENAHVIETNQSVNVEKFQTLEKVQSVSKHWMKAYRKIKIGHASIRMLDELSHKGSGCSLEITPHATTASTASSVTAGTTPVSGSLENLAGGEVLRRSSITSLPTSTPTPPTKPPRIALVQPEKKVDEWEQKLYGKHGKDTKPTYSPSTLNRNSIERILMNGETEKNLYNSSNTRITPDVLKKFEGKSREDLIEMVLDLESKLNEKRNQQNDLEDYLDNLLLRVMETSPRILQNPYISCKTQAQ